MDSRASNQQVYAVTSYYKGQLVAIKKYEIKSLVINRKMQKEMKVVWYFMAELLSGILHKHVFLCVQSYVTDIYNYI